MRCTCFWYLLCCCACLRANTAAQRGAGREYHVMGVLRRKPGRGDPTLSHSCSDKIMRWTVLGISLFRFSWHFYISDSVLLFPLFCFTAPTFLRRFVCIVAFRRLARRSACAICIAHVFVECRCRQFVRCHCAAQGHCCTHRLINRYIHHYCCKWPDILYCCC